MKSEVKLKALMGRTSSSSKRRYSKKKSLKLSSEAHRKKKSRRNELKKLRRHDDSFSSSFDDVSTSSSVFSSSSSDGEYKSKISRPRARSEVKGSKKRIRRRSLSEDSSGKDSTPVKKRKRSKKKGDEKKKKKNKKKNKKKKSRRDTYISSASSDSESCSACKDDGDSSSDGGASRMRSRGRSREKKKDHRDSKKGENGSGKNRSRTRSSSPSNSYDDESVEKVIVENNSRRLKSIITVVKSPENDEDDMQRDELKEEIVYDNDDYPSCKSNDSNELVDRSNVSPKKKILPSVIGKVNSASSLNDSKEKKSNATGSEVDKLELILRQRALENLSKFRGGTKPKTVVSVNDKHSRDQSSVKQLTCLSVDLGQTQSKLPAHEQDGFSMKPVSQPVVPRSRFTWRRDPSVTTGKVEKAVTHSGPHTSELQPVAPKLQTARLSSTSSVENKTVIKEKASTYSETLPSGPRPAALKLQRTHLSPTSRVEKKTVSETSESIVNTDNTSSGTETKVDQKSITALETSESASSTKEGSSKEQQNETTDSSQFEKKTMSVMRGGEMVQVSYKVYIPTRAPALARRQLKR